MQKNTITQNKIHNHENLPSHSPSQNSTSQIFNVSNSIYEGILQVQNNNNTRPHPPILQNSFPTISSSSNFSSEDYFFGNQSGITNHNSTTNLLQPIALPVKASDIIQSVAQQNLPLRIEVTLHLNDLIPISVISGLCIILLAILPVLIYRMRQNL